ncbi:hypothetical protein ACGFIY_00040 [Micromonospora chersina]|uniref:hypothetical protein n=1 Tax=Micromonospora chersina TaxID=47854 RepID=UPI00372188F9
MALFRRSLFGAVIAGSSRVFAKTSISRQLAAGALAMAASAAGVMTIASPASATRTLNTVMFGIGGDDLTITYFASENADNVSVDIPAGGNNRIVFTDPNASSMSIINNGSLTGTLCTLDDPTHISCPKFAFDSNPNLREVRNVSIVGWAGSDNLSTSGSGMVVASVTNGVASESTFTPIQASLSGFEDADTLTANGGYSYLVGGPGDDTLTSGPGKTTGDSQFKDRVDGGAGNDTIDTETNSPDQDTITCDNQADVVPDPDTFLSDSLNKDSGDNVLNYFVLPNTLIPSGCDIIS